MGIKDGLKKACGAAKNAACGFADTVKQEYKRKQLENELSSLYETLGQVRYGEILDGGAPSEESARLCEEISRIKAELENFDTYKDKENVKNTCKYCEKELPSDVAFCPYCGEKTNKED